jgi:hypothetical protein
MCLRFLKKSVLKLLDRTVHTAQLVKTSKALTKQTVYTLATATFIVELLHFEQQTLHCALNYRQNNN